MTHHRTFCWIMLIACAGCAGSSAPAMQAPAQPAATTPTSTPANTGTSGTLSPAGRSGGAGQTAVAGSIPTSNGGNKASGGAGSSGMTGGSAAADNDAGVSDAGVNDAGAVRGAPRGTGPGDWVAGDYPDALDSGNWLEISNVPGQQGARQYRVHVPPQYDPKTPMPVVFCIHGLGQDGVLFCVQGANMTAKADSAGFIVIMPNGSGNSWNAGTCCGDAVSQGLDDVGLFRAIFAEVSKHLNIDLTRVYATGLSNGGYMSYRLACEASDLFVAVAPGAGAIGMADIGGGTSTASDIKACSPKLPVSVLDIHGTSDPLIPYDTQKPSLDRIAMGDGCKVMTHPATQPQSMGDATCVSYDCPAGVDVTGCSVQGGGHVWFGSPNCGTGVDAACSIVGANTKDIMNTDAVWSFFSAHSRP